MCEVFNVYCQLYVLLIYSLIVSRPERTIKEEIQAPLSESNRETLDLLLQEIMLKTLSSYDSVTILSDSIYLHIFQKPWFRRFDNYVSFVMIGVNESEDLLAPGNETQSSLYTAKKDGCKMYIILISNGLQASRLLKFGDRYRVLNTRSNYVLLYDNRLFDKNMLYIWKRIINVVFIKKYNSKQSDGQFSTNDWYELSTVPFPASFENILIPRRLDIWTKSKFRKGAELFKDKTADLKNQTLKVVAFSHIPGTVKYNASSSNTITAHLISNSNDSFAGAEIEILETISKLMNFQYEIYEPDNADIELWGRQLVGGIYTGLLGEMTTARADLALGDLYYIPFILDIMDLSIPYNTECLTFLTPEALTDVSWKTLILPFSPLMWTGVTLGLLISSMAFFMLANFHIYITKIKKSCKRKIKMDADKIQENKKTVINLSICSQINRLNDDMKYSLLKEQYRRPIGEDDPQGLYQFSNPENSILYTYSMLLLVSLPKLPTGWSLRMLTGWYWLYCLLVVVAYRASLTAILARPTPRVTIDSLQELIDTKLTYGGWGEINAKFFKSSADDFIKRIGYHFQIVNNSEDAVDRVAEGNFAFYENTYFLKEAILKRQIRFQEYNKENDTNQTIPNIESLMECDRSLHIMSDCIINMPVSIGLQKNSPIKPRLDKLIRRVVEAGMVEKWLNDVMQKILNDKIGQSEHGRKALMNLKKMYGALVVLGIGYVLGIFALIGELLHHKYIVKQTPIFNKYSQMICNLKKAN